jgi:hypothetical protein
MSNRIWRLECPNGAALAFNVVTDLVVPFTSTPAQRISAPYTLVWSGSCSYSRRPNVVRGLCASSARGVIAPRIAVTEIFTAETAELAEQH